MFASTQNLNSSQKGKYGRSKTNAGYCSLESHFSVYGNYIEHFWGGPTLRGNKMTTSEEMAFVIFIIMTVAFFIWVAYLVVKKQEIEYRKKPKPANTPWKV